MKNNKYLELQYSSGLTLGLQGALVFKDLALEFTINHRFYSVLLRYQVILEIKGKLRNYSKQYATILWSLKLT